MPTFIGTNPAPGGERRIIKRYSNRKLYDTRDSRYVTLLDLGELIRNGQDIQVIDKATEADKTDVTLALIIAEELKSGPRGVPLQTLRTLARERGERLIQQLRGGPIGRLIAREAEREPEAPDEGHVPQWTADGVAQSNASEELVANQDPGPGSRGLRATLEQWQLFLDERLRAVVPNFSQLSQLEQEIQRLRERVKRLEEALQGAIHEDPPKAGSPTDP